MHPKEQRIRKDILQKVKEMYKIKRAQDAFIPGTTPVAYAGRQYDAAEMMLLAESMMDFWLTAGRFAADFEKRFAAYLGVKYCALVNSGSSANLLALGALTSPLLKHRRLQPGDEVITTASGFPTTLNPIVQYQLTPVFADIELGTYNIDIKQLEKAVTSKTRAIFIAHTLGNPADLGRIMKIVRKYDLWFIEDNCDALGSRYAENLTGTFGHLATFSFYPAHHITMGEGGAVVTGDPLLKRIVLSLRDWGRDCWCATGQDNTCKKRFSQQHGELPFGYDHKYVYSHIGYNLKVTDMQAAVGLAQLKKLPDFIKARQDNFAWFSKRLTKYRKYFILPQATQDSQPSWFGFPLYVKKNRLFSRTDIVNHLEKHKIATRMLFGGNLTKQPAYSELKYRLAGNLKNTDAIMNHLFWIGVYPGMTPEKRQYILAVLEDFFKGLR